MVEDKDDEQLIFERLNWAVTTLDELPGHLYGDIRITHNVDFVVEVRYWRSGCERYTINKIVTWEDVRTCRVNPFEMVIRAMLGEMKAKYDDARPVSTS